MSTLENTGYEYEDYLSERLQQKYGHEYNIYDQEEISDRYSGTEMFDFLIESKIPNYEDFHSSNYGQSLMIFIQCKNTKNVLKYKDIIPYTSTFRSLINVKNDKHQVFSYNSFLIIDTSNGVDKSKSNDKTKDEIDLEKRAQSNINLCNKEIRNQNRFKIDKFVKCVANISLGSNVDEINFIDVTEPAKTKDFKKQSDKLIELLDGKIEIYKKHIKSYEYKHAFVYGSIVVGLFKGFQWGFSSE